MNAPHADELFSRLAEDPEFRQELRLDPVAALSSRGMEVSEDQERELRELDQSVPDEELAERVSKAYQHWSDQRLKRLIHRI